MNDIEREQARQDFEAGATWLREQRAQQREAHEQRTKTATTSAA